ncbi:ATP-dependent DNA ligase [Cutaneotrichosporon oleaginosum]|uniref:DNA ligase n=1 Tax=Cutaneotrichosporon oleaginosum TaxID=879819 RepID=A0A0J1B745_9TREE|nr:ATP-dependent DNA ligase [Cutaneotrichosporon oleaginosum]KLT43549.1 ATP-dependent DNA ligase [Cutaneotrichosporon oleaginosum]
MPAGKYFHGRRQAPPPVSAKDEDELPLSQGAPLPPPTQLDRPRECVNRFQTPPFSVLCSVMDRLRTEEAGKRKDILLRFMNQWRVKVGNDLYPLIRLLLPDRDRERPVYNLKEAMLAKCYIEVLGIDKHSESAQRLIKWKQPVEGQTDGGAGDFARVCYHEIAARSTVEEGKLSVEAVNTLLDRLAAGKMKQADYVPILRRINEQCTPSEQEWIIRIILKDLRISIREKGVFSCFHPDAATLFNVCSDLKRVCWTLYKPEIRLEKSQANIELFRCFLPQLCHRSPSSSHDTIAKLVGAPNAEFIMEEKLDGERIQLHMRGSGTEWFYCSRKAKDYTYLYGSHIGEGSLTQYLAGVFQDDVRNIILDGEMMVWDPILEKYLAFGTLKTAASDRVADDISPRPCFKVFDILYLNDRCLTGARLSERKRLLKSGRIFRDIDDYRGRIEFVDEERGKTGKDIRATLERILESKGEGIVVKRADSQYVTNSRASDWVKVKPEYADQMGENLDLLVLGGWWGKGGRTGKISSLLLGLRVPQEDDGSGKLPQFETFAKVGSGMSYEDYESKHKQDWKPFDRKNPPPWMKVSAIGFDDKPDVYIEPDKSFVMEVKASEIVASATGYGCGYTLRFPRCRFIFWDRSSRDQPASEAHRDRDMWNCLSLDEFKTLLQNPKKRYMDDENGTSTRKKRRLPQTRKKVELLSDFKGQSLPDDGVEDHIFRDITFFIPKDAPGYSKQELEELVFKHGGDYTQAQLADNSAIVISSDNKTPRVTAQIRKGISVVKPQWILESIKRKRPIPLLKELLVFASEDASNQRYFNMTLDEMDKVSLVRDRTGSALIPAYDRDNESKLGSSPTMEPSPPQMSQTEERAAARDAEWGLQQPSSHSSTVIASADSDEETEDERQVLRENDEDEEVYDDDDGEEYQPMGNGADDYDEDLIFTHLVFYMDTAANAARNGLAKSSPPEEATQRLVEAEEKLRAHGGRVTDDVDDPALTHIIIDDDDSRRYVELMRRTAKPKLKHIVLPSWVDESLDEDTLMDEDSHKPK